jgi:hypothetical protein
MDESFVTLFSLWMKYGTVKNDKVQIRLIENVKDTLGKRLIDALDSLKCNYEIEIVEERHGYTEIMIPYMYVTILSDDIRSSLLEHYEPTIQIAYIGFYYMTFEKLPEWAWTLDSNKAKVFLDAIKNSCMYDIDYIYTVEKEYADDLMRLSQLAGVETEFEHSRKERHHLNRFAEHGARKVFNDYYIRFV